MATIPKLYSRPKIDLGIPDASGVRHIEDIRHFTPHKIDRAVMASLFTGVPDNLKSIARHMISEDWKIYVVDQSRGRCYYMGKTITIPVWAVTGFLSDGRQATNARGDILGHKIWYIAHELAHAYTVSDSHGSLFMARLIETCPPEFTHYELGYKPRNAASAGIVSPASKTDTSIHSNLGF